MGTEQSTPTRRRRRNVTLMDTDFGSPFHYWKSRNICLAIWRTQGYVPNSGTPRRCLWIYLFIYYLLDDALSSSSHTISKSGLVNRIWKEEVMAYLKLLSQHSSCETDDKYRILGVQAKIRTIYLSTTSPKRYCLSQLAQYVNVIIPDNLHNYSHLRPYCLHKSRWKIS
jgi:hypothetical protein